MNRRTTEQQPFRIATVLMVASGFAGLAYQIVWTQQAALWLGHEAAAVLAVVAAFFGGLAAGALLLGARIERSRRPDLWYAGCEVVIGLWSLLLALLLEPVADALLLMLGPTPSAAWQWFVTFGGTFVLLLPATLAMGATLPAMERMLASIRWQRATIGRLYAANTFGAVLGTLVAACWLIPHLGLLRTAVLCTLLNFGCALASQSLRSVPAPPERPSTADAGLLWILFATGLLGIGFEVSVVRALSQTTENTIYTFALVLAVYLIGTAAGASLYARRLADTATPERLRDRLLQLLSASCLLSILVLGSAHHLHAWLLRHAGHDMTSLLAVEGLLAACVFLLPTFFMGALFSHLCTCARAGGTNLGRALGINTLGAALAPIVFGVLLLPVVGLTVTCVTSAAGYLLLSPTAWRRPAQWVTAGAAVACVLVVPGMSAVAVPEGGQLVSRVEGVTASVSVIRDAAGIDTLHINNRQQEGSSATLIADGRQALLPLLLHPDPRSVLFLGVGTGLTASSATLDPDVEVDAVDLVPEVLEATRYFSTARAAAADPSRLHLLTADARRYVRSADKHYDVIVADNFHPARSGSGTLYTVEHFSLVRQRLAAGGVFCQWLPLHQLDLPTLRSIVQSFRQVFPDGAALLATHSLDTPVVGLISRRDGEPYSIAALHSRIESLRQHLDGFGIADDISVLGSFIAGPRSLAAFSAAAPLNTDDRPVVVYLAPRITYVPDSLPRDRLIALLRAVRVDAGEVLQLADRATWSDRLDRYWHARNRFIEAGYRVHADPDVRRMLAQVRDPLLSVLRTSPEFRPAYDPLLRMAMALSQVDTAGAQALLTQLQEVQPARTEAAMALHELGGP